MKLDMEPFPVCMVELMNKKVLVRTDQAEKTKLNDVVISDELHKWMIKPHNPEIGVWKENVLRKPAKRVKATSAMLIKIYQHLLEEDWMYQMG
jgi:bifunctional pyridoxal-dependent enzyme with beta-cystathionase and maltose regulon repressor activities